MKVAKVVTVIVVLVFSLMEASAQSNETRFGFELNPGVSYSTGKLAGADLHTGFGFEGVFHYRFLPHTGLYGGWGWNRFEADKTFAGDNVCFEETGYVFGLQFKHALGKLPLSYYLRAGGLYNHIEMENETGTIINDSGHGLGWQLAGGIGIDLSSGWSLMPGIKFNSLSRDVDFEGKSKELKYQYLSIRVGIVKSF